MLFVFWLVCNLFAHPVTAQLLCVTWCYQACPIGPEYNILEPGPEQCRRLWLEQPILSRQDMAILTATTYKGWKVRCMCYILWRLFDRFIEIYQEVNFSNVINCVHVKSSASCITHTYVRYFDAILLLIEIGDCIKDPVPILYLEMFKITTFIFSSALPRPLCL